MILLSGILAACGSDSPDLPDLAAEVPAAWLGDGVTPGHGGLPLAVDPELRDGITALADCAATVSVCLEGTSGDFDRCMRRAPVCETDTPWSEAQPCCPRACRDQYDERRAAGASGFDAYVEVMVHDGSCVPTLASRGAP